MDPDHEARLQRVDQAWQKACDSMLVDRASTNLVQVAIGLSLLRDACREHGPTTARVSLLTGVSPEDIYRLGGIS